MFPEEEILDSTPQEFIDHANEFYEAAKTLPFQAWLQIMTPIWEKQLHEMRLNGWLIAQERPEE